MSVSTSAKRSKKIIEGNESTAPRFITCVVATGVHGKFDISQEFQPGINVIYGTNGTGKTTLLHILANALNGDYSRFPYLNFKKIRIELNNNRAIELRRREARSGGSVILNVAVDNQAPVEIRFRRTEGPEGVTFRLVRAAGEQDQPNITRETRQLIARTGRAEPLLPAAYFPAFRTMIEAWSTLRDDNSAGSSALLRRDQYERYLMERNLLAHSTYTSREAVRSRATTFARSLFGAFVPTVNYPSPIDIERRLNSEIRRTLLRVGETDRELHSKAFLDIFSALRKKRQRIQETSEAIVEEIVALLNKVEESALAPESMPEATLYKNLREQVMSIQLRQSTETQTVRILDIYRQSIRERVIAQENAFEGIKRYLTSVNSFLERKELKILPASDNSPAPSIAIVFDNKSQSRLQALSSGEREIVTLIYAATRMTNEKVVLIDEPELSLHVDWQRELLREMAEQLPDRQIIACTHSPVIGADHLSRRHELTWSSTPTNEQGLDDTLVDDTTDYEAEIDEVDDIPF